MGNKQMGCSKCAVPYSDLRHIPRDLGCGHIVCQLCLTAVLASDKKCPECHQSLTHSDASEFEVRYLLHKIECSFPSASPTEVRLDEAKYAAVPEPDAGKCPAHQSRMFFWCTKCSVWVCRDCLVVKHPKETCKVLSIHDALEEMKRAGRGNVYEKINEMNKINKSLEDKLQNVCGMINNIKSALKDLESTKAEMETKMIETSKVNEAAQQAWIRVEKTTRGNEFQSALEKSKDCEEALENSIKDIFEIQEINYISSIRKNMLVGLVDCGTNIIVTESKYGHNRYARISRQGNKVHLHALEDGEPENGSFTCPYDVVRKFVPFDSTTVFMDIAWKGLVQGRVYVQMFGNTPRSTQAVYLYSGEKGPCYRGTRFYKVTRKGEPGECIHGGDYENNNGTGGRGIVAKITDKGCYNHEVISGLVSGKYSDQKHILGCFEVILKDWPGYYNYWTFGKVTEGLDILSLAASLPSAQSASVHDCGLVMLVDSK